MSDYNIRWPYDPDLYVPRDRELDEARQWLASKKRLLTVTAIPATGKSWFLQHLRADLLQRNCVIFWIDANQLLPENNDPNKNIPRLSSERIGHWLINFIAENQPDYDQLPTDFNQPQELLIEQVARAIGEACWPDQEVIIFIDGGDELSTDGWHEFERHILETFAGQSGLRFVIALRDKQMVRSAILRWSEQRINLEVWPGQATIGTSPGEEQFAKLTAKNLENDVTVTKRLESLLANCSGYDKSHPGINAFLYEFVKTNSLLDVDIEGKEYLKLALKAIIPTIKDDELDTIITLLLGIADFEDTWIVEDIIDWLDVSSSHASEHVQILKENWLVTTIGSGQFKIHDGIRQFARCVLNIVSRVEIHTVGDETLDSAKRKEFVSALAESLNSRPDEIHDLPDIGRVVLDLPAEQANRLKQMVDSGDLQELQISWVEFIPSSSLLRVLIREHFNKNEIVILCSNLRILHEDIIKDTLTGTVLELIQYCERHGRLSDLLNECARQRPHVTWPRID